MKKQQISLLAGNAHPAFAQAVSEAANIPLLNVTNTHFADGENRVELHDNVRNQHVFIIQPTCPPANEHVMELAILADALRRSSAASITAVIPYFGYARQDRKVAKRAPITSRLIADLIAASGVDRVLIVDIHAMQIQGFFDIPVDHLNASPVFELDIRQKYDLENAIVVSPDAGGMGRARALAKRLDNLPLAMVDKRRDKPNDVATMNLIGDVAGKTCIVLDDMIDTGGTISAVARTLKEKGAEKVVAYISHGLFSDPAPERLKTTTFDEIVVTNTIPLRPEIAALNVVRQVNMAPYVAEAIQRIYSGESISDVYENFPESLAG